MVAVGAFAGIAGPSTAHAAALTPDVSSDFFPIGVFYQPADPSRNNTTSFDAWKGRGVNTLFGYENQGGAVSIDQWSQAAVDAGLYMIRQARDNPADDIGQPNLLAWLQPIDEPDGRGVDPSVYQSAYATLKAVDPTRPVVANFDGSRVVHWQGNVSAATYAAYGKGADWVAQDIYPVTGFNKQDVNPITATNPSVLSIVGKAVDTLRADTTTATGPKPVFAFIETSNQRLFATSHPEWSERGPTAGEFRAEVWDAIVHGANGIMYFPQSFNSFRYDATSLDVAHEMTVQDAAIASLGGVLNSTDTPDVSTLTFSKPSLEAITKSLNGVTYLIVLNMSPSTVTSTISGNFTEAGDGLQVLGEGRALTATSLNTFSDTFPAYGYHVYAEVPAGATPVAVVVPEPATVGSMGVVAATLLVGRRRKRRAV